MGFVHHRRRPLRALFMIFAHLFVIGVEHDLDVRVKFECFYYIYGG